MQARETEEGEKACRKEEGLGENSGDVHDEESIVDDDEDDNELEMEIMTMGGSKKRNHEGRLTRSQEGDLRDGGRGEEQKDQCQQEQGQSHWSSSMEYADYYGFQVCRHTLVCRFVSPEYALEQMKRNSLSAVLQAKKSSSSSSSSASVSRLNIRDSLNKYKPSSKRGKQSGAGKRVGEKRTGRDTGTVEKVGGRGNKRLKRSVANMSNMSAVEGETEEKEKDGKNGDGDGEAGEEVSEDVFKVSKFFTKRGGSISTTHLRERESKRTGAAPPTKKGRPGQGVARGRGRGRKGKR